MPLTETQGVKRPLRHDAVLFPSTKNRGVVKAKTTYDY